MPFEHSSCGTDENSYPFNVFDAHCDTLSNASGQFDSRSIMQYSGYFQVFACFTDMMKEDPYQRANEQIDLYNHKYSHIPSFLAIEGGEALNGDLSNVDYFYNRGVRLITLTWNYENQLAGSCLTPDVGLKPFGREVISRMEQLGMAVDISHISDMAFFEVAEHAKKPFMTSHSNARSVTNHPRNLTDEQFITLIAANGITGINLCRDFIGDSIDCIVAHIDHFMGLGGQRNVGIGADFDGVDTLPDGISSNAHLYKIFDALLQRNYPQNLVEDIAYNNMSNFFKKGA